MMDPTVGRWTTEDPEGFTAKDMNLYRYCKNSPTNFTDPTGLDPDWDAIAQQKARAEAILNDPKKKGTYVPGGTNRSFTLDELKIIHQWEETQAWLRTYKGKIPPMISGEDPNKGIVNQTIIQEQIRLGVTRPEEVTGSRLNTEVGSPEFAKPDGVRSDPELRPYVTRAIAMFSEGVASGKYKPENSRDPMGPKFLGCDGVGVITSDYWTLIDLGENPKYPDCKIVAQVISQSQRTLPYSDAQIVYHDLPPASPLKVKAIGITVMGEGKFAKNPEVLFKHAEELYKGQKWAEFLKDAIEVGKYIPIVKTAIEVDTILDQASKDPSKLTVWDYAGAAWSFIDDVLTITGPFLKPGTFTIKGIQAAKGAKSIKIVVVATEGAKAAEGATLAEKAGALAVERKVLQYSEKEGATFVERGAAKLAEKEGPVGKRL